MKFIHFPNKIFLTFLIFVILFSWNGSLPISVIGQSLNPTSPSLRQTEPKLVEKFVDVDEMKLRFVESGKGRPVVLIHGNAGSIQDYEFGTLAQISGKYRTIALDLPGHGSSERKEKTMTLKEQAAILHRALDEIGIKNPIVVGHSWGGAVALAYGLQYPNDVAGLVLLAPAAYPDPASQSRIASLLDVPVLGDIALVVAKPIVSMKILKDELETAFYPDKIPQNYLDKVKDEWLGTKQIKTFIYDDQELNKSLPELSNTYNTLQMPVVIVTGDLDRMVIPEQNAYLLHKTIKQSKLIVLKNMGHQIPQTRPEAVLEAVKTSFAEARRRKSNADIGKNRQRSN